MRDSHSGCNPAVDSELCIVFTTDPRNSGSLHKIAAALNLTISRLKGVSYRAFGSHRHTTDTNNKEVMECLLTNC